MRGVPGRDHPLAADTARGHQADAVPVGRRRLWSLSAGGSEPPEDRGCWPPRRVTPLPYRCLVVSAASTLHAELERAVRTIQRLVREATPGTASGDQARALVALFAEAERAAASGIALFTPVVIETGSFAKVGHGSAAEWLGAVSGSSAGAARARLAAAERASGDEALTGALHGGDLSSAQLKVMSDTVAVAPGSAETLLQMAEVGASLQEIDDAAARLRAAARSKEDARIRRARVHRFRHFRWHQAPDGGIRGEFLCDEIAWARVAPRLESEAKERWKAAGKGDALEAHRLDALLSALGGPRRGKTRDSGEAKPHALVIVDAAALRRGRTQRGELCEIDGIGPVSVEAATELVGEAGLQFLVRDGVDIRTVTSTRRDVPQRVSVALVVRDRTCAVPGCGKRHGLETDHRAVDFAQGGPTCLENLVRLCPEHHDLKTHGGWRLEGGPGQWKWVAPDRPKSARYIAGARALAAAKANAGRNRPRRT